MVPFLLLLLLLAVPVHAHQIGVRVVGRCALPHCDGQDVVIGKSAGSDEKPKCVYHVEQTCAEPLVCDRGRCIEPSTPSLTIIVPQDGATYSRDERFTVLFDVTNQPEGSHIDISVDGTVSHNAFSPKPLGQLGPGKHTIIISIMSRGHSVMQGLEKTIVFTVATASITGPTLFVPPQPAVVRDPEPVIPFTAYNLPERMHIDVFLNGDLVKHAVTSPIKIHLQEGKNEIMLQAAFRDETLDQGTKKKIVLEYVPDPCRLISCSSPPTACYRAEGTCTEGLCTYAPLPKGSACTMTEACDGNGTCTIARPLPPFKSYVANPTSEERKGKLFVALERLKKGTWREVHSVDPARITIPPYGYYDVASFWNKRADFTFSDPGQYRFFVQFDTTQQYKEFTVKEK